MPRSILSLSDVAGILHISQRETARMAEKKILPARKMGGQWQFRASEIWNWIESNLDSLSRQRARDRHPVSTSDLLIVKHLPFDSIALDLAAKSRSSILRALARLAEAGNPSIDAADLTDKLIQRENQFSTAIQNGIAIPHPAGPIPCDRPILAAARTCQAVPFGQRDGGLTDLFFLVVCPSHKDHLLFLGRWCRLLIEPELCRALRAAPDAAAFLDAIQKTETRICAGA